MKIDEFKGKYYFLSNFYTADVDYKGITYLNNEAAFQAMKTESEAERLKFVGLSPSEAKGLGRRVQLRKDWDEVKTNYMYEIVKSKFEQNKELKSKLLATGEVLLEEGNTWGDKIWGTVNGIGENRLGLILMEVRDNLRVEG